MFNPDLKARKNVVYGFSLLLMMKPLLSYLEEALAEEIDTTGPMDGPNWICAEDLIDSMQDFCEMVWSNRSLIHSETDAHCLLYFWTYISVDDGIIVLSLLNSIFRQERSEEAKLKFAEAMILDCDDSDFGMDFVSDLAHTLSKALRDERYTGEAAAYLLNLCVILMTLLPEGTNPLLKVKLPEGEELMVGLVVAAQRLLCSPFEELYTERCLKDIITTIVYVQASETSVSNMHNVFVQLGKYWGNLGFIQVIQSTMMFSIRHGLDEIAGVCNFLLDFYWRSVQVFVKDSPGAALGNTGMYQTSASFWHDGLDSLLEAPTEGKAASDKAKAKASALKAWRTFGSHMGFSESSRHALADRGPYLSDEKAYWRIPKRAAGECCTATPSAKPGTGKQGIVVYARASDLT
ncbi:hypothetical protein EIP91_010503 [Steccherinum ochraceum]|uniref:Uncharacterized protein n=1 Tax=Steccherinum ochraceum TaxID=92696 RepID=A0A4R0R0J4_9APHY|nr:hypothetical protein EIP91_010503 [Steccherinum ochraceum]